MAVVIHQSDLGEQIKAPVRLDNRRRRLSTVMRQQTRVRGRAFIVSVHRTPDIRAALAGNEQHFRANDYNGKSRKVWKETMVGPNDIVVITYLPLGGMGGGGGGGKQIGMMLGMLLLSAVMPMFLGAIGITGLAAKVITLGVVVGAQMFMSSAMKPKANKKDERPVYGISGGGNLPRAGDRIPVHYGRVWSTPDLSQPDFFRYEGGDANGEGEQILMKRMTIGLGEYDIHTIRVGKSIIWKDGDLKPPFDSDNGAEIEIVNPGELSELVPSSVFSNEQVSGIEMARSSDNPAWSGPFPVCPVGETTKKIQLDFSFPQGLYAILSGKQDGGERPHLAVVTFQIAKIDADDNIVGSWSTLHQETFIRQSTRALRFTRFKTVAEGRYAVRAQTNPKNELVKAKGGTTYDQVSWDGLRGWLGKEPRRPHVTELSMRIKSGKSTGNIGSFSDIWVEHTRKLPTWNGVAWSAPVATDNAVWAAVDVIRNTTYGYAAPDGKLDLPVFLHYATTIPRFNSFNGTLRGPVAVLEAVNTILGVIRSEARIIGDFWSMTRDEPRSLRKHEITRRQILRDTTGAKYDLDMSDGASDVIIEYDVDADPQRRNEIRQTIGEVSLTPRRIKGYGIVDHEHAAHIALWYAAVAYWRRQHRQFTTELSGRAMLRNDTAHIDAWFLDEKQTAGVESRNGYNVTLDADITYAPGLNAMFRNQQGLEWGPVAVTAYDPDTRTITLLASDVAVVETFFGQSFVGLFNRSRRKLPMSVSLGPIETITKPFLIRTARPGESGSMQIEAVIDAPQVWSILGEQVPPPPPTSGVPQDDTDVAPILPWVQANVVQRAVGLTVDWAVAPTRGAVAYQIDIRYGDDSTTASDEDNLPSGSAVPAAWENIYIGPAVDGYAVIGYRENVQLRVRARAFNAKNVPSAYVFTSCDLFKPVVSDEYAQLLVKIENLSAQLKLDIDYANSLAEGSLRDGLKNLNQRVDELALAAATVAGTNYEKVELIKVQVGDAWAAIQEEVRVRVEDGEALAQRITTMVAEVTSDVDGKIQAAITQEATARANQDEALAQTITTMQASVGEGTQAYIDAQIQQEASVRASADGATAQTIQVVKTTVDGHTTQINDVAISVNGVMAQKTVDIVIDGQTATGFSLKGWRNLDGSVSGLMSIYGNMFVDGTITGRKLEASNIITNSAQIGWATILGAHIIDAQIDNLKVAGRTLTTSQTITAIVNGAGNGTAQLRVDTRNGSNVVLIATYVPAKGIDSETFTTSPTLTLNAAGGPVLVADIPKVLSRVLFFGSADHYMYAPAPTTIQAAVGPFGSGSITAQAVVSGALSGKVILTTLEFAR